MKKLLFLLSTILCFTAVNAHTQNLAMQECDTCIMAPEPSGCTPVTSLCGINNEITGKIPVCNLSECECPCHKLTKEELYQKLCLTKCQIDQANALYEKYKCDTQGITDTLKCEKDKLCQLEQSCSSKFIIDAHKKKVKNLKKKLKCFCEKFEKDFLCILTMDQQNHYKEMKKQQKNRCKKSECCKKYNQK